MFKLMMPAKEVPSLTSLKYPLYIQPKFSGIRCVYLPYKGLYDRFGNLITNSVLTTQLEAIKRTGMWVIDGILTALEPINLIEHKFVNGLKFVLFDCMSSTQWELQKSTMVYEDRLRQTRVLLNDRIGDYSNFIDIPTDLVESPQEVKTHLKKYLQEDFKGVIIRDMSGKYEFKKCGIKGGNMLKLEK